MAKAILVIDMPESCEESPVINCIHDNMRFKIRSEYCHMQEIPEKMDGLMAAELIHDCENPVAFAHGWNALREKIIGGAE